jgi:hypothetical protein
LQSLLYLCREMQNVLWFEENYGSTGVSWTSIYIIALDRVSF